MIMNVTESEFEQAQKCELANWEKDASNVTRIIYELEEHSGAIEPLRQISKGRRYERALEVGVGCYGLGFLGVHFFDQIDHLDGVDPLPRLTLNLNDPLLQAYVDGVQSRVQYRQARGEALMAEDATYDLVASVNVVDHARDPAAIVSEIDRVLKPGGHFLFGVNTLSWAGEIKWKLNRWRNPDAWLFRAHPHTYQSTLR